MTTPPDPQYPYNPYGTPYPAGLGDPGPEPVRRPGTMIASLVLMILSALPSLAGGLLFVAGASSAGSTLSSGQLGQLRDAGIDPVSVLRGAGIAVAVVALGYIALAVLAFLGRNWARILATVLTVGLLLLLVGASALVGAVGQDPVTFVVVLAPVLLATVGVVGLFLPASSRYYADPRR